MVRIVLDTSVLISGLRSRNGASFQILRAVAARTVRPLVTTALFLEYEAVLTRPEQIAVHGLSIDEVSRMMSEFAALCEPVELHFLWRPQLPDPCDEMVLEAAVNGRADALVTHNVRDFRQAADAFDLRTLKPDEFLKGLQR